MDKINPQIVIKYLNETILIILSPFLICISHCLLTLSQNQKPSNIVICLNRSGDSKKNHPAREVTETVFSTEVRSVRHQRTPPSFKGNLTSNL